MSQPGSSSPCTRLGSCSSKQSVNEHLEPLYTQVCNEKKLNKTLTYKMLITKHTGGQSMARTHNCFKCDLYRNWHFLSTQEEETLENWSESVYRRILNQYRTASVIFRVQLVQKNSPRTVTSAFTCRRLISLT